MLNDNALLAMTYLEAYQLTEHPLYAEIAESIFSYVLREMTSSEGAFHAAEGANSEGRLDDIMNLPARRLKMYWV